MLRGIYLMENKSFEPYIFYKEYPFIKEILTALGEFSSVAVVAGGCPRDIYLDKNFSDIDIYTASDCNFVQVINMLGLLPQVTKIQVQVGDFMPEQYKVEHISAVISFQARGIPFQIVVTKKHSLDTILGDFAVNLSKFYFEDRNIIPHHTALLDISQKKITPNRSVVVNRHYIDKISKKFPTYKVMKHESPISI